MGCLAGLGVESDPATGTNPVWWSGSFDWGGEWFLGYYLFKYRELVAE